jgi:FtsP/CotA-like multicopper oxidase with cupredoxin domain
MVNRREFLAVTGATAVGAALASVPRFFSVAALPLAKPDLTLRIAPVSMEIAPGTVIKTVGYNGKVPGPLLRTREGKRITVDVHNDTDIPELVHWHGQFVGSEVDGSEEEGTPMVPAHGSRQYTFVPGPRGSRWYHTHTMSMEHLDRGGFTGQFGFFYVEPKNEAGNYDHEIFLAAHHWEPSLAHMGPQNNGWEIAYNSCSINDKALGHGDPIRVKQGQRVLFRFLNSSATEDVQLALPGHKFKVLALDGNPVPTQAEVEVLTVAIAERVDAIVEMNQPGVWILGSVNDDMRTKGMGVVIEYADQKGEPGWVKTARAPWDYSIFGIQDKAPEPDGRFELTFKKIPGERITFNHWTINDKSWPDTDPLIVQAGKRYRMILHNETGDAHPVHLHRHDFEIVNMGGKAMAGVKKDIVNIPRMSNAELDFVANHPGPSLFHCHMQLHMDFGFKVLVKYA